METIQEIARQNQQKAYRIIEDVQLIPAWESVGAQVNLVGSLKTGLLVKHKDIDFHIYTDKLDISQSFAAVAKIAEHPSITNILYGNLIDTEEECIEWHATYKDADGESWQIDMIHILRGSQFDGYFERMADRINEIMTEEQKEAILRLKYDTPDTEKIIGVEYYKAVIQDGVRSFEEFMKWRKQYPLEGILMWIP